MLEHLRVAMVGEAGGELRHEAQPLFDLPQQNRASVRRDPTAIEPSHDFPSADLLKSERSLGTLCFHETVSSVKCKLEFPPRLTSGEAVSLQPRSEKCGLSPRLSADS